MSRFKLAVAMLVCTDTLLQSPIVAAREMDADVDDGVVLSFSTVGDSPEDPTTPGLSGRNAIWLQNTKAWSRIIDSVAKQKSNFLFFNGDMIMGYDNAIVRAACGAGRHFWLYRRGGHAGAVGCVAGWPLRAVVADRDRKTS